MKLKGPFIAHSGDMIKSPAWRALSREALHVLGRIEVEHLSHGGKENGILVVTYSDFEGYGVGHYRSIAQGIREAEALGFLQIKRGRAGNGEFKSSNKYRLSYLTTYFNGVEQPPTDEWKLIKDIDDAKSRMKSAKTHRKRSAWFNDKTAKRVSLRA